MFESATLLFFRRVMEKMRIPTNIVHRQNISAQTIDLGLRNYLGREQDYEESIREALGFAQENTVYKITDPYFCSYVFLLLPGTGGNMALVLGPYISFEMRQERLLEEAERMGVNAADFRTLEAFYQNLTVLQDDVVLMPMLTTLAEELWGSEQAYRFVDIKQGSTVSKFPLWDRENAGDSAMEMRLAEQRYAFENDLLDKVSKGLWHRVSLMLHPTNLAHLESRTVDPVRNQKYFCIVCNTLLRKAAEKGGVHPLHLDKISTHFSRQIELIAGVKDGQDMIQEMAKEYCRLVRLHSVRDYSALIQKVITYIDTEIASDLSLRRLAQLHSVSPEYLSSLFHKETGKTLTRFISEKRVSLGADLLRTTTLQVQTIAEYCGFPDAGYFAKVFKKHFGLSPKAFREQEDRSLIK